MNKATHYGHCQACEREQRMPGGLMAKHGYTVPHRGMGGWFFGTCRGSDSKAFEQDCAITKMMIAETEKQREIAWKLAAEYKNKPTPDDVRILHKNRGAGVNMAFYMPCRIFMHENRLAYMVKSDDKEAIHYIRFGYYGTDLPKAAQKLNEKFADIKEHEADMMTRYIERQTLRVEGWKPMPLKEINE